MRKFGFGALLIGVMLSSAGAHPADLDQARIFDREVDRLLTVTLAAPEAVDPVAFTSFYRQRPG